MATTFPGSIQTFPTMQDVTAADMTYVKQYATFMQQGKITEAAAILSNITNVNNKLITASLLNTINDTTEALESYYLTKFSPAYVVSSTQPASQDTGDFWFDVNRTV